MTEFPEPPEWQWTALTAEDLSDDPEPVSDEWAEAYEDWLDRRDTEAAEGYALADAEPDLFQKYCYEFVWPRTSGRTAGIVIAERKGHHKSWYTQSVPDRGKVRWRVERHLDPPRFWHRTVWAKPGIRPSFAYWLALPHGDWTRNVTIDLDNHVTPLAIFKKGYFSLEPIWPGTRIYPPDPPILALPDLSVEFLEQAKRLHGALGSEAKWCVSSRSLGLHAILTLDRPTGSNRASKNARQIVADAGLPRGTEVYPWGQHAHRLPFGLDFYSFTESGDLITEFPEQMRQYLAGPPAPSWDDLFSGLYRHWHGLFREGSPHIVGKRVWRKLYARMEATKKAIDRWRSGASVPVLVDVGRDASVWKLPSARQTCSTPSDWSSYVEGFKLTSRHYWLSMVKDLAHRGLPCHDCIDRAAREVARFLIHVQGLEPHQAADLVCRWAEFKSNGFVTRLLNGSGKDVRGQIHRIVDHVAGEEDFGGRLARMRAKLALGQYRNPIDLPALMAAPAEQSPPAPTPTAERKEERVILVDKELSNEAIEAIWGNVQSRVLPYQPQALRRRPSWWQVVRSVVSYLQAHGGEASVPKEVQVGFGGSPPTVKAVLDKLVLAGVIVKGRRRYGQPICYKLVLPT